MSVRRIGWLATTLLAVGCAAGGGGAGETPGVRDRGVGTDGGRAIVVGAILPRSGSAYLERYGELVHQGMELAISEHEEAGGSPVALRVIDAGGDSTRAAAALDSLERGGAVAVIGPLVPEAFEAAVRARRDSRLVMIGPVSPAAPAAPNTYALNSPDELGAEALARYGVRAGMRRIALLYPRSTEHVRQAEAFARALVAAGGSVVAEVPYDVGTTTFAAQLTAIAAAKPDAIYVPAPESDVQQIAPQVTYYGLAGAGVRVLGGDGWTTRTVRRGVAGRYLDGVVAATPLLASSPDVSWSDFVERYERTYRRSLDNVYPALGHDAMTLVLAALDGGRPGADRVAARIREIRDLRGATGVLSVAGGRVVRRPFVVRIEQGELVPVTTPDTAAPVGAPDGGRRDR